MICVNAAPKSLLSGNALAPAADLGDAAEAAVLQLVRAAVAEQVVGGGVADDLRERRAEVVAVGERLAAGVRGERLQRLLRRGQLIELPTDAAAREGAAAERARAGGVAT